MRTPLHERGGGMASQFWRDEAYLRQEFSRIGTASLRGDRLENAGRLDSLLATELSCTDDLRTAHTNIAASAALLPITPEMAWAVPQLLKRIQLISPGVVSTSGALRSLIRMPQWDEEFAKAFADSGFLSCSRVLERARWKYDIKEMIAMHHAGSAWQVLEHGRTLLTQHYTKQPLDWSCAHAELHTLVSWFPELRTLQLLDQLYERLYVLHMKSVLVVQCWLDWRAGLADPTPQLSQTLRQA